MHGLKRVASSPHHDNKANDSNNGITNQSSILSNEELSTIVGHDDQDNVEMFTPETVERDAQTPTTTVTTTSTRTTALTPLNFVYQRSRLLQRENEDSCVTIDENNQNRQYRISWKNNLCEYNDGSVWEQEQERRKKQRQQPTITAESFVTYYKFVAKDSSLRENQQKQPTITTSSSSASSMNHRRVTLISPRGQHHNRHHHHRHHRRRSHQRRRNKDPQWRATQVEKANEKWRMNVRGNV
jgi:hypothetical protein